MLRNAIVKRINITSPYQEPNIRIRNFLERIDYVRLLEMINLIAITGKSQSGKSTFARWICEKYDRHYVTVFTVEDILNYIDKIKKLYYDDMEEWKRMRWKWIFWDEPQLEIDKTEFWSQRNIVLGMLTSSYGFLKQNMVVALPNLRKLSDNLLTNLTYRIDMKAVLGRNREIIRKAYFKKPIYIERKNKYGWTTFQQITVPFIEEDKKYDKAKADNFFNTQLPMWRKRVDIEKGEGKPIRPLSVPQIVKMLKAGVINRDLAIHELEKRGIDFIRADLLLDSNGL